MKYVEIAGYPNPYSTDTHRVIGHIIIKPEWLGGITANLAQQTQAYLLGHDEAGDGYLVVHVACTTKAILACLRDRCKTQGHWTDVQS